MSKYVGIPFIDKGRSFDGADCYGLFRLFYEHELGIELKEFKISCYATPLISNQIQTQLDLEWTEINHPKINCLVLFSIDRELPDVINHMGLILPDSRFLHTMEKTGSYIERLEHPFFKNKIKGYYEYNLIT